MFYHAYPVGDLCTMLTIGAKLGQIASGLSSQESAVKGVESQLSQHWPVVLMISTNKEIEKTSGHPSSSHLLRTSLEHILGLSIA